MKYLKKFIQAIAAVALLVFAFPFMAAGAVYHFASEAFKFGKSDISDMIVDSIICP